MRLQAGAAAWRKMDGLHDTSLCILVGNTCTIRETGGEATFVENK